VIGVYVAWRGLDITLPVAKFLTFYSRKSTGYTVAAQNGCLAFSGVTAADVSSLGLSRSNVT
jgi:hypothetical protein